MHPDPDYADVEIDVNMVDAVSIYVNHIRAYKIPITRKVVERRVSLEPLGAWAKGMFGTADFMARDRAVLLVDDYKHGEGVEVEVNGNTQFMYYALGALLTLPDPHVIKQVRTTAIQPRKPHDDGPIRSCTYSVQALLDWGNTVLKEAVWATEQPDAPLVPSEKACMFCRAKGTCKALARDATAKAMLDFGDDGQVVSLVDLKKLTPEQVAGILRSESYVQKWLAGVAELAFNSLVQGHDITGGEYKLVAGRGSRSWRNEKATEKALIELGYSRSDIYNEKFKSPNQVETLVGKQQKDKISSLVVSMEGKPTLAPISDKRETILKGPEDDFDILS